MPSPGSRVREAGHHRQRARAARSQPLEDEHAPTLAQKKGDIGFDVPRWQSYAGCVQAEGKRGSSQTYFSRRLLEAFVFSPLFYQSGSGGTQLSACFQELVNFTNQPSGLGQKFVCFPAHPFNLVGGFVSGFRSAGFAGRDHQTG
jgi:hypothetical protein